MMRASRKAGWWGILSLMSLCVLPFTGHTQIVQDFEDLGWPTGWGSHEYDGWSIHNARVWQGPNDSTRTCWLHDHTNTWLRTAVLPNGVTEITYAHSRHNDATPEYVIETSVNQADWTIHYTGTPPVIYATFATNTVVVNDFRSNLYLRFRRISPASSAYHRFDNIVIYEPDAAVTFEEDSFSLTPANPYVSDPADVEIQIIPVAAAQNITAQVFYRYDSGSAWSVADLDAAANDFFETNTQRLQPPSGTTAGTLELYFEASYEDGEGNPLSQVYPSGAPATTISANTLAALDIGNFEFDPEAPQASEYVDVSISIDELGASVSEIEATAYYRYDGEAWTGLTLTNSAGSIYVTSDAERIPAPAATGRTLDAYIEVTFKGYDGIELTQLYPANAPVGFETTTSIDAMLIDNVTLDPPSPIASDPADVSVRIEPIGASASLESAALRYRFDDAAWTTTALTPTGGLYHATSGIDSIAPAGAGNRVLEYYILLEVRGADDILFNQTLPANAPVDVFDADTINALEFDNLELTPDPPTAVAETRVAIDINPVGNAENITATLHYRYGGTGGYTALPMSDISGDTFATPVDGGIPACEIEGALLEFYIEADFDPAPGAPFGAQMQPEFDPPEGEVAPYTRTVVTGSLSGQMAVESNVGATRNLVLTGNYTWQGVITNTPLNNPTFWYTDGTTTWGDDAATGTLPLVGTAAEGESIELIDMIEQNLAFRFVETNLAYAVRLAVYEPFELWTDAIAIGHAESVTNAAGWVLQAGEVRGDDLGLEPFVGRHASLRYDGSLHSFAMTPELTGGVGEVSFWYRLEPGAVAPAGLRVEKRNGALDAWIHVGHIDDIDNDTHRYHSFTVGDIEAERIRIVSTNALGNSWVELDEIIVTRTGAAVVLSDPTQIPETPDLGLPVTVGITATPMNDAQIQSMTVYYRSGTTGAFATMPMTTGGGNVYTADIPAMPPGTVEYYFHCDFTGVDALPTTYPKDAIDNDNYLSYLLGDLPGDDRHEDFEDLAWPSAFGIHTNQNWVIHRGRVVQPLNYTRIAYLNDEVGGFIQSPLLINGVGNIYFWTQSQANYPINFDVEVWNNAVDGWELIGTGTSPGNAAEGYWHRFEVMRYDDLYVRITRTSISPGNVRLGIDNITLSPPPADVTITERLFQPGYPSRKDNVQVRAFVEDVSPDFPAVSREVSVHYRWEGGAWNIAPMGPVGGDLYEGVIPAHEAGAMEYYFRCAFQGFHYVHTPPEPHPVYDGHNEDQSPRFLPAAPIGAEAPTEFLSYMIRMFDSEHGTVEAAGTAVSDEGVVAPLTGTMELVGDNTWQTLIDMSSTTNLVIRFHGIEAYTNNAPGYADTPDIWGDEVEFPNPPLSGFATPDGVYLNIDYDRGAFLMIRFNPITGEYTIKRAVYQDFNEWQADELYFEESFGLYGVQSFPLDFDSWSRDIVTDGQRSFDDFQSYPPGDAYQSFPPLNLNHWSAQHAQLLQERQYYDSTQTELGRNRAVMLQPGFGTIETSGQAMTDGIDTFSFRYRAALQDERRAWYRQGFSTGWDQYSVYTRMRADSVSPANPSLSVFALYQDPENYYEYRIVQVYDNAVGNPDNLLRAQIWRRSGGIDEMLLETGTFAGRLTAPDYLNVRFRADDLGNQVELEGWVGGTQRGIFTDSSAQRIQGAGSIAFLGRDAVAQIQSVSVTNSTSGYLWDDQFTGSLDSSWFNGGQRPDGGGPRWTTANGVLTRLIAPHTFAIDVQPAAGASAPNQSAWTNYSTRTTSSLAYQTGSPVNLKYWDKTFVRIRQLPGDSAVVVDDLNIEPWRGRLREGNAWKATEAWIGAGGVPPTGNELQLTRSRANPALVQALTTPELDNGLGSIGFSYVVDNGPSHFAIQRTVPGLADTWVTVPDGVVTNNSGERESFFIPVRTNMIGRLRVVHLPSSAPTATLRIDNVLVRDYPKTDDSTWVAYNALITGHPTQSDRAFEPTKPEARTAYLNYDPEEGTRENEELTQHLPYIQSPSISEGIGEIAFWYRVWDPPEVDDRPGVLYLRKAPSEDTPSNEWELIDTLTVTNEIFYYYQTEIFDNVNKVFRLYAETNNTQRVAVDNMLVTEPVRAGFEIVDVELDPPQPLSGESVSVDARLTRFIMNPSNIVMRVAWHAGPTNQAHWGMANWPSTNWVGMAEIGDRLYRTETSIPPRAIDEAVQFIVYAEYDGQFASPITQTEFTNPAWYYPVDLNEEFAGWSPYYFVYSCPPGTVWINEFNYRLRSGEEDNEYVELIGPAGARISDWRIELIDPNTMQPYYEPCIVAPNTVLPSVTNGWGFFVWGDAGVTNVDQTFDQPRNNNLFTSGGIRLVRSMGAWEHRISYGTTTAVQQDMVDAGYEYVGAKSLLRFAPLHLEGEGDNYDDFAWAIAGNQQHTPGGSNIAQILLEIDPMPDVPPLASVDIQLFHRVGGQLEIIAIGTNQWTATLEYRTNLLTGADWAPVEPQPIAHYNDAGYFSIMFDPQTGSPVYFYRVTAEPMQ